MASFYFLFCLFVSTVNRNQKHNLTDTRVLLEKTALGIFVNRCLNFIRFYNDAHAIKFSGYEKVNTKSCLSPLPTLPPLPLCNFLA